MSIRTRKMWVIYINVDNTWKEHSRTGNRYESMKIYDALLKAGNKVNVQEQYY